MTDKVQNAPLPPSVRILHAHEAGEGVTLSAQEVKDLLSRVLHENSVGSLGPSVKEIWEEYATHNRERSTPGMRGQESVFDECPCYHCERGERTPPVVYEGWTLETLGEPPVEGYKPYYIDHLIFGWELRWEPDDTYDENYVIEDWPFEDLYVTGEDLQKLGFLSATAKHERLEKKLKAESEATP